MIVGVVLGPTRTLFWPAGVFFSLGFWHRYTAEPLTVTSISRVSMPRPASEAVQVVDVEFVPVAVIVHAGSTPVPPTQRAPLSQRQRQRRRTFVAFGSPPRVGVLTRMGDLPS